MPFLSKNARRSELGLTAGPGAAVPAVELARVVGISPASASEHAKVLREVYLIETLREGRAVRHSLTALGRTMLGQLPASPRGGEG
jgi:DNA-binding transcriptional ArsR family regulator